MRDLPIRIMMIFAKRILGQFVIRNNLSILKKIQRAKADFLNLSLGRRREMNLPPAATYPSKGKKQKKRQIQAKIFLAR
jgi:hypothetical protein